MRYSAAEKAEGDILRLIGHAAVETRSECDLLKVGGSFPQGSGQPREITLEDRLN
jgi:hypothetical protein